MSGSFIKYNGETIYTGLKLPDHTGAFVQSFGGYKEYHEHLRQNDIAAPVYEMENDKEVYIGLRVIYHPVAAKVKVGRNEPCPCGSGKKYKKCCINK